jgi:hypothetical protein
VNLIEQIAAEHTRVMRLPAYLRTRHGYTELTESVVDSARALYQSGVLSKDNVEIILNLGQGALDSVIESDASRRIGGRLSAGSIVWILDAFTSYRCGDYGSAKAALRACVPHTSLRMAARLAEVPYSTAWRWVPVEERV